MPRFLIYSDLHYEMGSRFAPPAHLRGKVDGVILAGDISAFPTVIRRAQSISDALDAPVVLLAGNHEFYGYVVEHVIDALHAHADDRVQFLECGSTEIGGTRILGTTLWTDYNLNPKLRVLAMSDMPELMEDYRAIKRVLRDETTCRIDTDYLLAAHMKCRDWLSRALNEKFNGPTIVVTHTAPSRQSIRSHNPNNVIAAGFASNLEDFICERDIALWAHGHIHDSVDYMIGGTRVVSNPYGYERDELNKEFDPEFMVEV
ncbi:MAG: metallophosphoesterase [Pseudomonadota bacterium]